MVDLATRWQGMARDGKLGKGKERPKGYHTTNQYINVE